MPPRFFKTERCCVLAFFYDSLKNSNDPKAIEAALIALLYKKGVGKMLMPSEDPFNDQEGNGKSHFLTVKKNTKALKTSSEMSVRLTDLSFAQRDAHVLLL